MSQPISQQADHPGQDLLVPMPDVARFLRQLSHDLRNHLNAAELQSAYIGEVAEDAELKGEVKRLRSMLNDMGETLQRLTNSMAPINPTTMSYEMANFVEDLQKKMASQFPEEAKSIEWEVKPSDAMLEIDPQVLQPAFLELFANAFAHERGTGPIRAKAEVQGSEFVFTLAEPKADFTAATTEWGRKPFGKMRHGHYGLGLARTRSIIEAHQGQFSARYDSSTSSLVTSVVLPLGSGQ